MKRIITIFIKYQFALILSMNLDEFVSPVSLAQLELKSPLSCRNVLGHVSYLLNEAERKSTGKAQWTFKELYRQTAHDLFSRCVDDARLSVTWEVFNSVKRELIR